MSNVLVDRPLWRHITDFQTGYPFAVLRVFKSGDIPAFVSVCHARGWELRRLFGDRLAMRGIATHLAIVAGDVCAFRVIYASSQRPQYHFVEKLDRSRAIRCAILFNRIDILDCIASLKAHARKPICEPHLLAIAMQCIDSIDMRVLAWIDTNAPHEVTRLPKLYLIRSATYNRLDVVRWLRAHRCKVSRLALHQAAINGHADMVAYLYTQTHDRCKAATVNTAAEHGHLDVVKVIVAHQRRATALHAIHCAARSGTLHVVAYLVDSGAQLDTRRVIDSSATSSNLEVVQFICERFPRAFTAQALVNAAVSGSVDVVAFLLETLVWDSTTVNAAMRSAVENDHLDVVSFLHTHCIRVTCPPSAFDVAARRGFLTIVKFLHTHRTEGCTPNALNWSAKHGHLEVVQFICEHYSNVVDVEVALKFAARDCHLEVVKYLHTRLQHDQSAFPALAVAARRSLSWHRSQQFNEIVAYMLDNERADEPASLRQQAAANSANEQQSANIVLAHRDTLAHKQKYLP